MQYYFKEYVYEIHGKAGPGIAADAEPERPDFTTMGGVFRHDYEAKNGYSKLKSGVKNRFFLPKTNHFDSKALHHVMSHWYFLRYTSIEKKTKTENPPRTLIAPYYLSQEYKMQANAESALRHMERGEVLRDQPRAGVARR